MEIILKGTKKECYEALDKISEIFTVSSYIYFKLGENSLEHGEIKVFVKTQDDLVFEKVTGAYEL